MNPEHLGYVLTVVYPLGVTIDRAFGIGGDRLFQKANHTHPTHGRRSNSLYVTAPENPRQEVGRNAEARNSDPPSAPSSTPCLKPGSSPSSRAARRHGQPCPFKSADQLVDNRTSGHMKGRGLEWQVRLPRVPRTTDRQDPGRQGDPTQRAQLNLRGAGSTPPIWPTGSLLRHWRQPSFC